MRLEDTISLYINYTLRNEDGDTYEETHQIPLGKCFILPNDKARKVQGQDNRLHEYSYMVFMKKPKQYPIIDGKFVINATMPVEGTEVEVSEEIPIAGAMMHLTKKDYSIDSDCTSSGFVLLKNWLKIWM